MLRWDAVRRAPDGAGVGGGRGREGTGDRGGASAQTGQPEETFPAACPFTLDQVTGDWLPEA